MCLNETNIMVILVIFTNFRSQLYRCLKQTKIKLKIILPYPSLDMNWDSWITFNAYEFELIWKILPAILR